jgi:hypothetical protein
MRLVGDHHECAHCGAHLDIQPDEVGIVVFRAASGQPNARVILVNGREIHRCEVRDTHPVYQQR